MSVKKWNYHSGILSCMRRTFTRSPIVREALQAAQHPTEKGPKGGRRIICSMCGGSFGASSIEVDHIEPVIPFDRKAQEMDWNEIAERLFCDVSGLRCLCKDCHEKVTNEQKRQRAIYARKKAGTFVVCMETGKIFPNEDEAATSCGLKSGSGIAKVCKTMKGKSGGYTWRYIKDTNIL